jgi:hypothetical protein
MIITEKKLSRTYPKAIGGLLEKNMIYPSC